MLTFSNQNLANKDIHQNLKDIDILINKEICYCLFLNFNIFNLRKYMIINISYRW